MVRSKSVFYKISVDYNLDLGFLVKKQISMIIADFSWGHKHFSWGYKRSLFFVGIQEVSARRVRKELINSNLYLRDHSELIIWLTVCKWCKIEEIHIITFNKIYLYSRHYFTSSNCIFMRLKGIVFIQLQGNDLLVNCQGNNSFKEHIHKKYNSRQLYSFIQGNYIKERSSFKENIQGNNIHSRKYIHLRNIYSFKFKAMYVHSRKLYSSNNVGFADIAEMFIQNLSQSLYDNYKLYN